MAFCNNCGAEVKDKQVVCLKCGCKINGESEQGEHNKIMAALFAIFLGWLGVHKFYLGQPALGVVYLLCGTIGWFLIIPGCIIAIVSLIEGIVYLCMSDSNFNAKYNN